MKYTYILLLVYAIFASCSNSNVSRFENATSVQIEDFSVKKLHGEIMELDPIWNPEELYLSDSLLFLLNRSGKTFVQTFNLNTNQLASENVPSGAGPNELTSCTGLIIDKGNNCIAAFDPQILTIRKYNYSYFINHSNVSPIESVQFDANAMRLIKLPGNKYLGTFVQRYNSLLSISDSLGHLTDFSLPYPNVSGFDVDDFEKKFAYGVIMAYNDEQRKVVVVYRSADVIDVYDDDFNLLKRIQGPYFILPTTDDSKRTMTYLRTSATSNYIFSLYSGHLMKDNCVELNTVFVYDYNLNPIVMYELDIPIFNLVVDENAHIIYGLADHPERCVVKFKF